MAGSTFINAQQIDYQQFKKETLEIVAFVKNQAAAQTKKAGTQPHARA
jgi:hypothetical protein